MFTNFQKTVSDAFRTIIRDEFTAVPGSPNIEVVLAEQFDPTYLANKGEYIRYWIEEDNLVSKVANGEDRVYLVDLYYYVDIFKKNIQRDWETLLSDRAEHIKTIINTNNSYAPSSVYKWHGAWVESISKPMLVSDTDDIELEGYENVRVVKLSIRINRGNFS